VEKTLINLVSSVVIRTDSKVLLVVADGLGGMALPETGLSELETAKHPNLDSLARESACGVTTPIYPGITPGSGPAHLSLFGYDPTKYEIGRGVLEALGSGIKLTCNDLACRANFATYDKSINEIVDRRAGRIPTDKNKELCSFLQKNITEIDGVKVLIKSGKEHRFVVVFTGDGLEFNLTENDPQKEHRAPLAVKAIDNGSKKSEIVINKFIDRVKELLKDEVPANYPLLRGFAKYPDIPSMGKLYKLTPAAVATYPMYRGLAQLVGMEILSTGETLADEIRTVKDNMSKFDFFYLHIKKTDAMGEDGNFDGKVKMIEEIDKYIPEIRGLGFDTIVFTGDHSTPAVMKGHSWHHVPALIWSKFTPINDVQKFTERECMHGSLGRMHACEVMPVALANALKLGKYGA